MFIYKNSFLFFVGTMYFFETNCLYIRGRVTVYIRPRDRWKRPKKYVHLTQDLLTLQPLMLYTFEMSFSLQQSQSTLYININMPCKVVIYYNHQKVFEYGHKVFSISQYATNLL